MKKFSDQLKYYMETEDEAGEEGKKLWAISRWGCKEGTKNLS